MQQNKAPANKTGDMIYTIRKGGKVYVRSSIPACGYSADELRQLREKGFELYENGKKAKKSKN